MVIPVKRIINQVLATFRVIRNIMENLSKGETTLNEAITKLYSMEKVLIFLISEIKAELKPRPKCPWHKRKEPCKICQRIRKKGDPADPVPQWKGYTGDL